MWLLKCVKPLQRARSRIYGTMHEPLDHVTGIQKRELLAHLAGECDPFRIMPIKKGPGTYECPNLIPSAFASRLVGCVCKPHAMHIEWMWVHMGWPRRCGCGYWFELCPIVPL
ncbi:cytochrome c oxidase subunit 5B, mitochondrial-like [Bicyclus anynana]|uniref:Cytochrome c oxidase subunit 5B, mitochondrial-like n=1 Tax=Bicyclus anynana TaxID=110368 RepID=A0ABM3LZ86_BICAN|nr:cytochrome c oxidase subunit 5B, mitochondrial-like [Bicyclus anynana]